VLERVQPILYKGRIQQVVGLLLESIGPAASIGDVCWIRLSDGNGYVMSEVVGFRGNRVLLMPLGDINNISPGMEVISRGERLMVKVGDALLGRVVDALGVPIDGKGAIVPEDYYPLYADPPHPLKRKSITEPIALGIRAVDGLITVGKGQRMGIFSGSGVGKSTLIGMIARNTNADVNVIALVGERGREVKEFIERDLGEEGLKRSVVVVATSDKPSLLRIKAAFTATTIAEYFRDRGKDVILMMDSVTRFAMAQREVGLAIGEPPATRGYTPSVFAVMPKLLERAGNSEKGSITGLYTVLVEGDDLTEPVADTVRSILDGHIVLSRNLASKNHFPAIDVLNSVSRVMVNIVSEEWMEYANKVRSILATYRDAEDLINIGAYVKGSNADIDEAIRLKKVVDDYLKQDMFERDTLQGAFEKLKGIFR